MGGRNSERPEMGRYDDWPWVCEASLACTKSGWCRDLSQGDRRHNILQEEVFRRMIIVLLAIRGKGGR